MVKINYSWNAEMRNPGQHADNDRSLKRKEGGKKEGALGVFQGRHNYIQSIDY